MKFIAAFLVTSLISYTGYLLYQKWKEEHGLDYDSHTETKPAKQVTVPYQQKPVNGDIYKKEVTHTGQLPIEPQCTMEWTVSYRR